MKKRSIHFFWIDGEGVGRWGANKGKMVASGGGGRASVGVVTRNGTTSGTHASGGK